VATSVSLTDLASAGDQTPLEGVHRVVVLGDSITHAGLYVEFLDSYFYSTFVRPAV
jgi:hypothetical protein